MPKFVQSIHRACKVSSRDTVLSRCAEIHFFSPTADVPINSHVFFTHNCETSLNVSLSPYYKPAMLRKLLTNPIYKRNSTLRFSSSINEPPPDGGGELNLNVYQEASEKMLEELSDRLDEILEDKFDCGADVSLNNGVLTVVIDQENTYVINKQTPNRQIWLSSPLSGPMRFDFISGQWVEKHSRTELRSLLSSELSKILKTKVDC